MAEAVRSFEAMLAGVRTRLDIADVLVVDETIRLVALAPETERYYVFSIVAGGISLASPSLTDQVMKVHQEVRQTWLMTQSTEPASS